MLSFLANVNCQQLQSDCMLTFRDVCMYTCVHTPFPHFVISESSTILFVIFLAKNTIRLIGSNCMEFFLITMWNL